VMVHCAPELVDLLSTARGVQRVTGWDQPPPQTDLELSMLSLPNRFATTLESIPAEVPYLASDPARTERLRSVLLDSAHKRVGIVWAGNPNHPNDRARSCPIESLGSLSQIEGVAFFSLQKGEPADRDRAAMQQLGWSDVGAHIRDFADTAAAMSLLDLIITVDTAAAHLAGALARPVWLLLSRVAEWRWMNARTDSPWYPTMRVMRQPSAGDWTEIIRRVRGELLASEK
ncbi:MAG: tetratricopeptide repeat protein, partial [Tepidisphaeraceae bacterium]